MKSQKTLIATAIAAVLSSVYPNAYANVDDTKAKPIEVITIKGDFEQQGVLQTPASIAVIDQSVINQRNAEHLQDVLNTAANVNFSVGASRARFY